MPEDDEEETCSVCGELKDECVCSHDSSCDDEELGREDGNDIHFNDS